METNATRERGTVQDRCPGVLEEGVGGFLRSANDPVGQKCTGRSPTMCMRRILEAIGFTPMSQTGGAATP